MMRINENINEENEELPILHELVSKPPNWIVKWGIIIFFIILISILGIASILKYPDTVAAEVKINTLNGPEPIMTKKSGTVVKILKNNGENVKKGDVLAWLESSANHDEVLKLHNRLLVLRSDIYERNKLPNVNNQLKITNIGELQGSYQVFYLDYLNFLSTINDGSHIKERNYLVNDLNQQNLLLETQLEQEKDYIKIYDLYEKEYTAYKKLAEKQIISSIEMDEKESILISKRQPLQQITSSILASKSHIYSIERKIRENEEKIINEKSLFLQSLNKIISEIDDWKQKFLIIANKDGFVVYSGVLQENQFFETSIPMFYIGPKNNNFFCELYVEQVSVGKIKRGQKVYINLHSYPFEQFGYLEGIIQEITEIPFKDSMYLATVKLQYPRKTSGSIELKKGMTGTAKIITENSNVIQKFGRKIKKAVL